MKNSLMRNWCVLVLFTLLISCKKDEEPEIVTAIVRVTHNNAPVMNADVGGAYSLDELDNNIYQHKQATNTAGEATIKIAKKDDLYFEVETYINGKPYYGKSHVSTLSDGKNIPVQEIKLAEAQFLPKQVVQTKGNNPNISYFNLTYFYDDQNRLVKIVRKSLVHKNTEEFCAFSYYPDGKLQRMDYGHGSNPTGGYIYVEFKHHPDMVVADYNYPGGLSSRIVDSIYFGLNGLPFILESNDIDHPNLNTNINFIYSGNNYLSRINEFQASNSNLLRSYNYYYDFSANPFKNDRNSWLQVKYGFKPFFLDEWGGITPRNLSSKDGNSSVDNYITYFNNRPDSVSTKFGFNPTELIRQKIHYCFR